jgi:cell division protein YceG involved in septum cleavage
MDLLLLILLIIIGILTFLLLKKERDLSINDQEKKYMIQIKIIRSKVGSILKETDIVKFQDIYVRVKLTNSST